MALLSTALAFGTALALAPVFNDAPVPLFMAAVMVSAWAGGLGPGLLATLVAGLALDRSFDLAGGSPLGWEDTVFDVGLLVAVAALISALNARLRRLHQRIQAAHAAAEAALGARDQVLSIVAHDLKSPLTGISLSAQLADRRLARAAPDVYDTVRDQLLNIEAGAEQMLGLIDDLLDVAHLRAGHTLQLRPERTRLLGVVEQAVSRQQPTSTAHASGGRRRGPERCVGRTADRAGAR